MLRDSTAVAVVVVVVRTRPRAIPLAIVHMRKSFHGFPSVPNMGMGLRLAALGRRSSAKNTKAIYIQKFLHFDEENVNKKGTVSKRWQTELKFALTVETSKNIDTIMYASKFPLKMNGQLLNASVSYTKSFFETSYALLERTMGLTLVKKGRWESKIYSETTYTINCKAVKTLTISHHTVFFLTQISFADWTGTKWMEHYLFPDCPETSLRLITDQIFRTKSTSLDLMTHQ